MDRYERMTRYLTENNPKIFLEICDTFHLNPKKIRNIQLGYGDDPIDNFISFETTDDMRLNFPLIIENSL